MAEKPKTEIVLYDLACTKNVCFSPVVWRIRLLLNYKRIPYTTIFLEFPDIEPRLKELGVIPPPESKGRYTVPTILHVPTNTYMMDSTPISQYLESTYPEPPLQLTSELGSKISAQARAFGGTIHRRSVMPREINILSPRSQEYFRRRAEASLGHPLEDLIDSDKEEQDWKAAAGDIQAVGELMRTHKDDGPFILGTRPSYNDFFIAGSLQSTRVIDEGIFQRYMVYPGFRDIYEACLSYMEKQT